MKILIGNRDKAFCLYIPLGLVCNRVGAALLSSGIRHTVLLSDGSGKVETQTGIITTAQMHGLLKTLKQSKQTLKQQGLPLVDIEEGDGSRIVITL